MAKQDFVEVLDGTLKSIAMQVIDSRLIGVMYEVNRVKSQYGKDLREIGIGTNSAPLFAASKSWKPLGDAWLKRKKASAAKPRYYQGLTGELGNEILAMPTEKIFGKTQLTAAANVRQAKGFFNPRTGQTIDTVFRDDRGRFASSKLKGVTNFTVRIDPFPEINNSPAADYIEKLPLGAKSKMKLKYNDDARPLIKGFTEWFYDNRIRFAIEQGMREVFK